MMPARGGLRGRPCASIVVPVLLAGWLVRAFQGATGEALAAGSFIFVEAARLEAITPPRAPPPLRWSIPGTPLPPLWRARRRLSRGETHAAVHGSFIILMNLPNVETLIFLVPASNHFMF